MFRDLAVAVLAAFFASLVICRFLISKGPLDPPSDPRKIHKAPTPTSGGLGIGVAFSIGLAVLWFDSTEWRYEVSRQGVAMLVMTLGFSGAFMVIGFVDDARHLSARLKFVLFGALAFAGAVIIRPVTSFPLSAEFTIALPYWIGLTGTALWVFTLVNCVNFMDGANGLAIGSVSVGLIAMALIGAEFGTLSVLALGLCGAAAGIGFLVWNFPGGRLFAGDSGALLAGSIAAFGSIMIIARTGMSPFVPPIIFFPILADALLTLLWRARRGRSLLVGHSEHIYQIALRAWRGHRRVALSYWAMMAACGALAYVVARDADPAAPLIALISLSLLAVIVSTFIRRWAITRGLLEP